jgi:hypothetical protein
MLGLARAKSCGAGVFLRRKRTLRPTRWATVVSSLFLRGCFEVTLEWRDGGSKLRSAEVRMPTRTVVLLALIAAVSSTTHAGSKGKDEGVREGRAAIEAANGEFSEALARGDAAAR